MRLKRFGPASATVVACALVAMAVGAVTATAGNSLNAKFCQTSWQTLFDGTGTSFANQGSCIAWGAQGNSYVSLVVSTSTNPDGLFYTATVTGHGLLPGATIALVGTIAGDPHQLELFSIVDANGDGSISDPEIPCGHTATISGASKTYLGAPVSSTATNPC